MESFVLFRTGKAEIIGPFITLKAAADHIVKENLLGYQILPLKSPTPDADAPFPPSKQTSAEFDTWTSKYVWTDRGHFASDHAISAGYFMTGAVKKFPDMFDLHLDIDAGEWFMPRKITMIKGLRKVFKDNGILLDLRDAKKLADDYEDTMREEKNK